MTDEDIVIPAIRQRLRQLGGNAADNVVANQPLTVVLVIMSGFPLACTEWTISGEALRVEQTAMSETGLSLRKIRWNLLTGYGKE